MSNLPVQIEAKLQRINETFAAKENQVALCRVIPVPLTVTGKEDIEAYQRREGSRVLRSVCNFFGRPNGQKIIEKASQFSLVNCVLELAETGLSIDPSAQEASIVTYGSDAQVAYQYRGLIKLAMNTGLISSIDALDVRQGDEFDYSFGLQPTLSHRPGPSGIRGDVTHAYAIARFRDGAFKFVVLDREEIERHRGFSRNWQAFKRGTISASNCTWEHSFPAMAIKTAIIVLNKQMTFSRDDRAGALFQKAVQEDMERETEGRFSSDAGAQMGAEFKAAGERITDVLETKTAAVELCDGSGFIPIAGSEAAQGCKGCANCRSAE